MTSIPAYVVCGLFAGAALLTGCSAGTAPATPLQAFAPGGFASTTSGVDRSSSWMMPDAKRAALLYVTDLYTQTVVVFSYPKGKVMGTLTGFAAPHGQCADKSGDVFIADTGANRILEYAHGGTAPIAILKDPRYFPSGCSVDPLSGDLAVANNGSFGTSPGGVSIYRHARGKAKVYFSSSDLFYSYYCAYDVAGNLYVDGTDVAGSGFRFAERSADGKTFAGVTLNQTFNHPGAVQWDGQNVAVGDQTSLTGPSNVYEFSISGSTGTKVGATALQGSCDVLQFTLDGKRLIAPNVCSPNVMYFNYPAGGAATRTLGGVTEPVGTAVSRAS